MELRAGSGAITALAITEPGKPPFGKLQNSCHRQDSEDRFD